MKTVYLDNAATTPMAEEVVEVMRKSMLEMFGNPSSTHQYGRKAKTVIETARKEIASYFKVSSSEIIFTSSGTESNNFILKNAVENLGVKRIITSKIEHHAVLHVVDFLKEKYNIEVEYVALDKFGSILLSDLEDKLASSKEKTLVSLMMVNNEIGNILPIKEVALMVKKYNGFFHSDTVQAIGYFDLNLSEIPVDFITASAHKFHGPKGVGFVFVRKGLVVKPIFYGGSQEKGARASTENVHGIVGMHEALRLSIKDRSDNLMHVQNIKNYVIEQLRSLNSDISFNGASADLKNSSPTILSVKLPIKNNMLLFNLDLKGIAASAGSACQSGSNKKSHVLTQVLEKEDLEFSSVRLSFSKYTKMMDIDFFIEIINSLIA